MKGLSVDSNLKRQAKVISRLKDSRIFFVSQSWWPTFAQKIFTSGRLISNSNSGHV